jgi:hypothetical protein
MLTPTATSFKHQKRLKQVFKDFFVDTRTVYKLFVSMKTTSDYGDCKLFQTATPADSFALFVLSFMRSQRTLIYCCEKSQIFIPTASRTPAPS